MSEMKPTMCGGRRIPPTEPCDECDELAMQFEQSLIDATNAADEAKQAADNAGNSASVVNQFRNDVNVLKARVDELTSLPDGSTSGDAELIDIRVGADGVTYPTAGDAVRGQITDLKSELGERTINLSDISKWSSANVSMSVSDGVASNIKTDTKTYLQFQVRTYNGNTMVDMPYNASETTRRRVITFTASGNADSIRLVHSGSIQDFSVTIPTTIVSGNTYTVSLDIIGANPTIIGGVVFKNIQTEEGSTASNYIPYFTATDFIARKSIQALDEITAKINATEFVNLIDKTSSIAGVITNGQISSSANAKTCFTKLEVGKRYVFYQSIKDSSLLIVGCSAGTALYSQVAQTVAFKSGFKVLQQENDKYPYVFTVPSGYPYFAVSYYDASSDTEYTETELLNSLYVTEYGGANSVLSDTAHDTWANNPIASVFSEEVDSVSNEIIAKTTSKALLLGIITDTHIDATYDIHNEVSMENMQKVNNNVSFDVAINMGDLIDGGEDKATEREFMRKGMGRLIEVGGKKFGALIGNHDNNGLNPSALFTDSELYGMMLRMNETEVNRDGITSNYYIDYPDLKIRLAFVDSVYQTAGFSTDTINWVSDILTNLPQGYRVVFISHEPTRWSLISTASGSMAGSAEMESVLSAHESVICGWIHGHTHFDNVSYVMTFPQISITCGKPQQYPSTNFPSGAVAPERTIGTITQDAWDSVLILPDENKFECIRFGAGNSRTVPFRQ